MKKIVITVVASLVTIAVLSFGGACAKAPTKPSAELPTVKWRCQLCCAPMSPAFTQKYGLKPSPDSILCDSGVSLTEELARRLAARTNGKFTMEIYAAGELVATTQAYEALEKGAIEFWFGPPWAFSGRNPFGYVSGSLPYSIENHDQAYDIMYKTKFREIARRAYAKNNIYYITGGMGGADGLLTKFPIYSMADLKGKKIRGGGIKGMVLEALGATDVAIPPAEVYTALKTGVVDGCILPFYVFGEWGLTETCKYVSEPPVFGNWWVDWACNMDAWNKLPKEYQEILQEEADNLWKWCLKTLLPHIEGVVKAEEQKKGVQYIRLSDQALAEIKSKVLPLWDKLAAMSPENAEVVEIYKTYLHMK